METYNDEEKRLDREWYGMDEGQDEYQNAFSNISDEYIKVRQCLIYFTHLLIGIEIDQTLFKTALKFLCQRMNQDVILLRSD